MSWVAAVAALAGIALGLWVPGGAVPVDHGGPLLEIMVQPTEPYVLLPAIALMTAWCAGKRRWHGLVLCLAGSLVPVALNTWVLKPLFDRPLHDYLAYPSGHTVSLVAVLTVLVLLAKRVLAAVLAVVVTVIAGTGLVGLGYHYPVDVAGGTCFAVALVLTIALVLRLVPVPSGGSPRGDTSSGSPPAASPR
ncbi:phosphatase PAP2 family protein [Amycolatopsis sp. K13G38]|uniref:Phosphatase PAP2 family protein n=1 Tax=Amycolatopsis acididurans TaxID=2724524 RepID=A0ABX1JCV7_9PSEU|nr:phosphatase PAP2 family protein [Amycolatopsis acididurans]NKQ56694.1 phosphatase PAP2 family protein [Amycolatopsis acididurans]